MACINDFNSTDCTDTITYTTNRIYYVCADQVKIMYFYTYPQIKEFYVEKLKISQEQYRQYKTKPFIQKYYKMSDSRSGKKGITINKRQGRI